MSSFDLRPLSLGEILDRTFTLYRGYFWLFIGISAIPRVLVLILGLAQVFVLAPMGITTGGAPRGTIGPPEDILKWLAILMVILGLTLIVSLLVVLLTQGATIIAVSELYLGRSITISESFRRVRGELGTLLGLLILNGLAVFAGFIFFIIPGIYIACRLLVAVPAALSENLGPVESLERSFSLTTDNAGRAFLILLLYAALLMAASALSAPFQFAAMFAKSSPGLAMFFLAMTQVGAFVGQVLVTPVVTIASAAFYYDLRVRKEAFDLQMLMNPTGAITPASGGIPTVLS